MTQRVTITVVDRNMSGRFAMLYKTWKALMKIHNTGGWCFLRMGACPTAKLLNRVLKTKLGIHDVDVELGSR